MDENTVKLVFFNRHLERSVEQLMDALGDGQGYDERFDIKIEFNGEKVTIPLCADTYERFKRFIEEEVEESSQ